MRSKRNGGGGKSDVFHQAGSLATRAALGSSLSAEGASLFCNLCSEPVLGLLSPAAAVVGSPKAYALPLPEPTTNARRLREVGRNLPQPGRRFLPGTGRCPRAPAGQTRPLPAPPRPDPLARPAGARPRRRGGGRSRCRSPRLPRTLRHRARHPPAQENKMFAAYDFQFQRLANGVQTSASSE